MSKAPVVVAAERSVLGKKVKNLRAEGQVPAVVYERGKTSIALVAPYLPVSKAYGEVGHHRPVELTIGSKKKLAMIKAVATDPVRNMIQHVEFHAIKQNEKVTAEVGITITGEVPAERANLVVLDVLRTIEIEALPAALPDTLEVDGSSLSAVGDKLTVADIKPVEGVTILTEPEQTIAVVEEPRSAEAEAAEAAAEAEATAEKMADLSAETTESSDSKAEGE